MAQSVRNIRISAIYVSTRGRFRLVRCLFFRFNSYINLYSFLNSFLRGPFELLRLSPIERHPSSRKNTTHCTPPPPYFDLGGTDPPLPPNALHCPWFPQKKIFVVLIFCLKARFSSPVATHGHVC